MGEDRDQGPGAGDQEKRGVGGGEQEVRGQRSEVGEQGPGVREQGPAVREQGLGARDQGKRGVEELRAVVREVMAEFVEERTQVTALEKRVNELVAEAEEARRSASIRAELQKLGVAKIDLAYKAVKDDVRGIGGGSELRDFLERFVSENPELLPARLSGGSGASTGQRKAATEGVDLSQIRPGMSAEEMDRVRREVARVASQTLKGWQ